MQRAQAVLIAMVAGMACAASAEAATPPCVPRGMEVLTRTTNTAVYLRNDEAYACRGRGRPVGLGSYDPVAAADPEAESDHVSPIRLAGRYVASAVQCYCAPFAEFAIRVHDLERRKRVLYRATGRPRPGGDGGDVGIGPATDLVLSRAGSVAWIADRQEGEPDVNEVHRCDTRGCRLLDAAPDIGPRTLRLRDGTIEWMRGGVRRTATLR